MYFLFHPISSLNHLVARLATDQISFLISILFFVYISLTYKNSFWTRLDKKIAEWALNSKETLVKKTSNELAVFGNAIFHILFSVLLSVIFFIAKHKSSVVLAILFTLIFSWAFNRFMKLIFKRTRPEYIHSETRKRLSYCYPSGHVMASISIYFFSAVLLQSFIPFLPWYLIAFVVSYFVVMSRIYLNHHYFTDVLGGIAMGIFSLNISIWAYFFIGLL